MSMYNLDSNGEYSYFPSNQSPTIVLHDSPLPMHMQEVHSSPITEKVPYERNYVDQGEDHLLSYNIEEIFGAFTFNLHGKEVSRKTVMKVKQSDGTFEEMQEDDVLFEKTYEDPMTIATASTSLSQASSHNITVLNENILEAES
jgi:hypothetical protein